ncbi:MULTISPECIES: J domain-containing protein [Trichocoleus]|uniref:J domain-containing protein n=1 Tax=Trichocoleus desertorum GB2-A4 TaxID=2933944 RepID=A0ABV0J4V2_9CYAN|nr:J domain-containing protein [Trichocoleus sp. FACHB-46]MBD1863642.1 J domain-containing protein [Trichocoleus sp. FACHB-46]
MPQTSFSADWLQKFSDPYAILGISVAADDSRVLKRYRNIAKVLHPDSFGATESETKQLASQIFARLVNPAYQKLKQEKDRTESLGLLRFQVRRLKREGAIAPKTKLAQQLSQLSLKDAEVFYEQAIAELGATQFQPIERFASVTQQLLELNLVYLQLKLDDVILREKRTGLVSSAPAQTIEFAPASPQEALATDYAYQHAKRAKEYLKKENLAQAVQELRDAIKIEPTQGEYHALLGFAYFKQNLSGMATVHFRQALKLNPKEPLALHYAAKLNLNLEDKVRPTQTTKKSGLFGLFGAKKP